MLRRVFLLFILAGLAACAQAPQPPRIGPDGQPLPRIYRIAASDADEVKFRVLDSVNALRRASNAAPVSFNAALNAAAETHSRDMSVQNRPWHFGSDGSSPIDRARRVGYDGRLIGEAISETFETETQTLAAWMDAEGTRRIILSPDARDMGFAFFQERNGKIWWTLVMGGPGDVLESAPRPDADLRATQRAVNATAASVFE